VLQVTALIDSLATSNIQYMKFLLAISFSFDHINDIIFILLCFFPYRLLATFIHDLFQLYTNLYFTYLEINPLGMLSIFKMTAYGTFASFCLKALLLH